MKRDPHSKAIIFPVDPAKKARKEMAKSVVHHSDEIKFLADCINYQQTVIEEQKKSLEEHKKIVSDLTKAAKKASK